MLIAISCTPEECQDHLLTLTTVFCCSCLAGGGGGGGVDAAAGWNPRTKLIACLGEINLITIALQTF